MAEWGEVLGVPIRHQQQEDQVSINQMFASLSLRTDQCSQQMHHQRLHSLQPGAFLPPNQVSFQNQMNHHHIQQEQHQHNIQSSNFLQRTPLPSTMYNHLYFGNQQRPPPTDYQLSSQYHQQQFQHQNWNRMQTCAMLPPTQYPPAIQKEVPFQTQLQELSQRGLMYGTPQHLQQHTHQAAISVPAGVRTLDTVTATRPVLVSAHDPHFQQQPNQQQLRHHEPPQNSPSVRPHSSVSTDNPQSSVAIEEQKPSSQPNHVRDDKEPMEIRMISIKEMWEFVNTFKRRRRIIGFSLKDVVLDLRKKKMRKRHCTWDYIQSFESFDLSFRKMCYLKPLLEQWLQSIEVSLISPHSSLNTSKSIHHIPISMRSRYVLEKSFRQNPTPGIEEIEKLAKLLHMDKFSVGVWFCNLRQTMKQNNCPIGNSMSCASSVTYPVETVPVVPRSSVTSNAY